MCKLLHYCRGKREHSLLGVGNVWANRVKGRRRGLIWGILWLLRMPCPELELQIGVGIRRASLTVCIPAVARVTNRWNW